MSKSTFSYEDAYGQVPAGSSLSSKQAGKFSYEDAFGSEPAPPASRGIKGTAQDVAATTVKAALAVPEAAVGVADLVTGGKAGKALEGVGVRFKEAREIAEGWHSDVTKAQKAEFQNAYGVAGKAAVVLSNPSLIAMAVGESLGAALWLPPVWARWVARARPSLALLVRVWWVLALLPSRSVRRR